MNSVTENKLLNFIYNTFPHIYQIESRNKHYSFFTYSRYSEFENNFKTYINKSEQIRFLYCYKKSINELLYYFNELISIDEIINKEFNSNFYLNLLITDYIDEKDKNTLNYIYSIDLIKKLNQINNKNDQGNHIIKILIGAKNIINLINHFKDFETYNEEEHKNLLENILSENKEVIENNIFIFQNFNLTVNTTEIIEQKIDVFYIQILNALITSNKFDDFRFIKNILEELDIKNININEKMFAELKRILNNNNSIKKYEILDFKDLFNNEKINFFYLLFKYILKSNFFIYQISFITKIRIFIIKIIKSNFIEKLYNFDFELNKNIIFVINFFLDSKYYSNLFLNSIKVVKLLKYYKLYFYESEIEQLIKSNNIKEEKYLKYFEESRISQKIEIKNKLLYNDKDKNLLEVMEKTNVAKKYNKNYINKNNRIVNIKEILLNNSKINKKTSLMPISIALNGKQNKKIKIKENEEILSSAFSNNINFSENKYLIKTINDNTKNDVEKIKIGEKFSSKCAFYLNYNNKTYNIDKIFIGNFNISLNVKYYIEAKYICLKNISNNKIAKEASLLFKIVQNIFLIIQKNFTFNYELSIKIFLEKRNNKISCRYLFNNPINNSKKEFKDDNIMENFKNSDNMNKLITEINDKDFEYLKYKYNKKDNHYKNNNTCFPEILSSEEQEDLTMENNIYFFIRFEKTIKFDKNIQNIYELNKGFYLVITSNNIYILNIFNNDFSKNIIINNFENPVVLGIESKKENQKEIIHLKSNQNNYTFLIDLENLSFQKIKSNNSKNIDIISEVKLGDNNFLSISKDKNSKEDHVLNFYDSNKISIRMVGIKFSNPHNILSMSINIENKENNKILLFACQRYYNYKNGLLLIILLKFGKEIEPFFFETNNFEPWSLCPIEIKENSIPNEQKSSEIGNQSFLNKNENYYNHNIISIHLEEKFIYFLVGGIYKNEKIPAMKIYKLYKNSSEYKIKYIQDVYIKNTENCIDPITSIIQSKENLKTFSFNLGKEIQFLCLNFK